MLITDVGWGIGEGWPRWVSWQANLKIRTKVLIALLPLAIMVFIAALYSSDRMSTIDARYSGLLDKDVKALIAKRNVVGRSHTLYGREACHQRRPGIRSRFIGVLGCRPRCARILAVSTEDPRERGSSRAL